jgi:hypothetical protein
MGKRKRVPENLMGSILGEDPGAPDGELVSPRPQGPGGTDPEPASPFPAGGGPAVWEEHPARVGATFNLSKQVCAELDRLRLDLGAEGGTRSSNSEIAEMALRIAIEDARERGMESDLVGRLNERSAARAAEVVGEDGRTIRRSVDDAGSIIETVYDENGQVVDEAVVASVADLPVQDEYVDEQGRLVSLTKDELGNTFEQVLDDSLNPLRTRLLSEAG